MVDILMNYLKKAWRDCGGVGSGFIVVGMHERDARASGCKHIFLIFLIQE